MKLFFCFSIFFLKCYSFSFAQKSTIFFSNMEKDSELINNQQSNEVKLFSLGDNSNSIIDLLSDDVHQILGDKDIKDVHVNGRVEFQGAKKKCICPGPEIEELDDNYVFITINSNWIIDEAYRYFAANEDCDIFNQVHMVEELQDVLEDYEDWNKVIIAHHPIRSISELDGKGLSHLNFIPFYGQLRRSFKANSGNLQDMPNPNYQRYIQALNRVLSNTDKLVFVSGHDRINSVIQEKHITYINVNSGDKNYVFEANEHSKFVSKGAMCLRFSNGEFSFVKDDRVEFTVEQAFSSKETAESTKPVKTIEEVASRTRASEKYHPTKIINFWMGSGYRDVWSEEVEAPLLDISKYDGGLEPYAIGGGLQTMSIKFKSKNGRKYAFRVLDKQPEKSLNEILQNSLYKGITQELITTMHPYAPLVAHELLEATDIIHIKPELFILDKSANLPEKYNPYVGKIGTLEEKPKGKGKNREGFYGADEVVTSYEMLIDLRRSHKSKMDKSAYAKARLMDMFIGDWDRHEDNWKWAMFKEDGRHIYKPIPKDRDHTFSHWTGLIPGVADMIIMNAEDFDYKFGNLRQLNFKARFLDRQLASELDLNAWLEAVDYIQSKMTDVVIDRAITKFPKEVRAMHGATIAAKLKSRREDLPRAIKEYYEELNREVQIRASNKKDYAKISRLENGDVIIDLCHIKKNGKYGKSYFQRKFEYGLVKRIFVFGLDGKDVFQFEGDVEKTIPVEIIGGNGRDRIIDNSLVRQSGKSIVVFDSYKEDVIAESKNIKIKRPTHVAHYDPYDFDFNWLVPKGSIRRSSGNGWGLGLGASLLTRGFNKVGFVNRYDFNGLYYFKLGAYRLDGKYTRNQFVGLTDLFVQSRFTTLNDRYPFFYGIGNDSEIVRSERRILNRIDYNYFDVRIGLEREFYTKSNWSNAIVYERHLVENFEDLEVIDSSLRGFGLDSFIGFSSALNLDFTDNSLYPLDGSRLSIQLDGRSSSDGDLSGNIDAKFAHYKTVDVGVKLTFTGSINYQQAVGNSNFYHLSKLGSQSNFRGYTRNRFTDKYAFLYNGEMRLNLGYVNTPLIRFYVGIIAYYNGGQVWARRSDFLKNEWNNSIGGGFFIAPGWEQFAITYTFGTQDDDFIYSKVQLGFDF